jgi:hypothetical protein
MTREVHTVKTSPEQPQAEEPGARPAGRTLQVRVSRVLFVCVGTAALLSLVGLFVNVGGPVAVVALVIGGVTLTPICLGSFYIIGLHPHAVLSITWIDCCPQCGELARRQQGEAQPRARWVCPQGHTFTTRFGWPIRLPGGDR